MSVKRVLTIEIFWAQARRADCEHCSRPYTWIDGGVESGQAEAGVAFADDNELRRDAFRKAADPIVEIAERPEYGRGRCPHCHQLQGWMVVSKATALIGTSVGALVAAGVLGLATGWFTTASTGGMVGGIAAGVGLLLALLFGGRLADKPGPQPDEKDPGVKTDEQLREWIDGHVARDRDPFLAWWRALGRERPAKAMEHSVGILDVAKEKLTVPETMTAAACARVLAVADG